MREYNVRRDTYDEVLGCYRRSKARGHENPDLKAHLDGEFQALHELHASIMSRRRQIAAAQQAAYA